MTRPKLTLVEQVADANIDAMRTLAVALAPFLLPLLREELARGGALDELVDVVEHVPAPPRTLQAACRSGAIEGARKVGRRWIAPRVSVDAWMRAHGPRAAEKKGGARDDLDALRDRWARPTKGRKRA